MRDIPLDIAFPKHKGLPTELMKSALNFTVPLNGAIELALPEVCIGPWSARVVAAVTVPVATMDEDGQSLPREHEVGLARQFGAEPIAITQVMYVATDSKLGRGIFAVNAAHVPAALFLREPVHARAP